MPLIVRRSARLSTTTPGPMRARARRWILSSWDFCIFNLLYFLLFLHVYIYLFALFVQLPFSSLSCAGSSWLPLPLVSFPSFSLLPTPNRPCHSERSPKARHEADSFEPAEWSGRLTPGQSGCMAGRCDCRFDPRSRSFSLSSTPIFSSVLSEKKKAT